MRELRHLTWPLLAASLVVGLAALVRLGDPEAAGADDITGVIRLPWGVTAAVAILVTLAALVFFSGVMRRLRSRRQEDDDVVPFGAEPVRRQPWLQVLAQILTLVNFLVIAYLFWKNVLPLEALSALGQGALADGAAPRADAPEAPWVVTSTFAVLALIAAAGALALAVWFTSGDRLAKWWTRDEEEPAPPALVDAVDDSVEDLRSEPDARRAIVRCYARFERAAAISGLTRMPWQTPMEFMRETLSRLPAPHAAVGALTALFELARFSDRPLGPAERDRALDALDAIKGTIDVAR